VIHLSRSRPRLEVARQDCTDFPTLGELTSREFEVLRLVASGHTNKAISQQLDITVRTIEAHRSRVMEKLGVKTLAEVVEVYRVAEKR